MKNVSYDISDSRHQLVTVHLQTCCMSIHHHIYRLTSDTLELNTQEL